MNKILLTIAAALAFAAVPSATAARSPAVKLGIAFYSEDARLKAAQVHVAEVTPGGTADLMGIRPGDVITHAGGKRMLSAQKLTAFIRRLKAGDVVEITVKRDGKALQLTGTAVASGS